MTISVRSARVLLGGLTALSTPALFSGLVAQGTLDDYRRSAAVTQRLAGLTVDVAQMPTWIGATRFWYRKSVKGGNEFVVVDASTGAKKAAFDHAKVATALSTATGETFSATPLPIPQFSYRARDASPHRPFQSQNSHTAIEMTRRSSSTRRGPDGSADWHSTSARERGRRARPVCRAAAAVPDRGARHVRRRLP